MDQLDRRQTEILDRKLKQHEEIIIQLLEIIAATNCKVEELTDQLNRQELLTHQ